MPRPCAGRVEVFTGVCVPVRPIPNIISTADTDELIRFRKLLHRRHAASGDAEEREFSFTAVQRPTAKNVPRMATPRARGNSSAARQPEL